MSVKFDPILNKILLDTEAPTITTAAVTTTVAVDVDTPMAAAKIIKWEIYVTLDSNTDLTASAEVKSFNNGTTVDYTISHIIDLGYGAIDIAAVVNGSDIRLEGTAAAASTFYVKRQIVV